MKRFPCEGRYCIDIMIESLFRDRTAAYKYVTETSEEIPTENVDLFISTGKPVAKAEPIPKLVVNLSSNSVPIHKRRWIDIDTQPFDHSCFDVSTFMTRTLRHEASIPREIDGAVKLDDLIEKLKVKFAGTLQ